MTAEQAKKLADLIRDKGIVVSDTDWPDYHRISHEVIGDYRYYLEEWLYHWPNEHASHFVIKVLKKGASKDEINFAVDNRGEQKGLLSDKKLLRDWGPSDCKLWKPDNSTNSPTK